MNTSDFSIWLDEKILEYIPRPFKKTQKDINFRCPICGDSKRSLSKMRGHYYFSSHAYYCFNCDTTLSGLKLLEILSNEDYKTLKAEYLKLKYQSPIKINQNKIIDKTPFDFFDLTPAINDKWKNPLTDTALKYLESRKIFESEHGMNVDFYSTFTKTKREYILIPWILNGIEAYFQLNDFLKYSDKKYIFPPKLNKLVFGLDWIDLNFPYIICFEGVYDSLFVKNGVALGGKKLTALQKTIISKRYPNHQIVLALDNDLAGKEAIRRSIRADKSLKYFDWAKTLKTKAKDINDFVLSTNDISMLSNEDFIKSCIKNPLLIQYSLALSGVY